jgi:hypothetical protein
MFSGLLHGYYTQRWKPSVDSGRAEAHRCRMTSETWISGGPIAEKVAIGAMVREFAATLGLGHVEASVRNYGDRLVVCDAIAWPLTAREQNVRAKLQAHLNPWTA